MTAELFELNPLTQMVELDKKWISTIREFKVILQRDKGVKGDTQARKKLQAQKEFTFIYHLIDYRSQLSNTAETERPKLALRNAELDVNLDYTKDIELMEAIEVYNSFQNVPALLVLEELKQGMHSAYKVAKKVRQQLERQLEKIDLDAEYDPKDNPTSKLTRALKDLLDLNNSIGPTIKQIEDQEKEVKTQLANLPRLRGGATKGINEDAPTFGAGEALPNPFANR